MNKQDILAASSCADRLRKGLERVIRGRRDTVNLLITALFSDGHVLLEDYPGSGKTSITRTLGQLIGGDNTGVGEHIIPFRRIQFTPDMLPGDVLGVNVFDPRSGQFHFVHGPVFAHVVLADEINRTGPKVQSAFLECMAEKQVTIDNFTHPLDELFFVIGTQNPLDIAGTYPLPLVQLDRFMFKIPMAYVDEQTELEILEQHEGIVSAMKDAVPVCSRSEVLKARKAVQSVHVSAEIRRCIVEIAAATRNTPLLRFGASTRASLMLQQALRGWAVVNDRDYATEDDLKLLCPLVLNHRLGIHSGTVNAEKTLNEIIEPAIEKLIHQ